MPNPQPRRPNSYPDDAPPCDPQLPLLALRHRMDHQLMSARAFSEYNVTAWLLKNDNSSEYIVKHNQTIKETEKKKPSDPENPARVGLHSEVFAAEDLKGRLDVLSGKTLVTQIFTERIPCSECRTMLAGAPFPGIKYVPRYYYLAYHDKKWQREQAEGSWGAFLMHCYRLVD
jgi:hypothetical protein